MRLERLFRLISCGLLVTTTLLCSYVIIDRWHAFESTRDNLYQADILQLGLSTIEKIAAERGPANASMGAGTDDTETLRTSIVSSRKKTDTTIDLMLAKLRVAPSPETTVIERDWLMLKQELAQTRALVDAILAQPPALRSSTEIAHVIDKMSALNQRIIRSTSLLEQSARHVTASAMASIQNAHIASMLRDQTGLLGSQFIPALAANRPLRKEETINVYRIRERIAQLHSMLNQKLNTLSPSQIRFWREKKQMEDNYFQQALPLIEKMMRVGQSSGNYGITPRELTEQYVPNLLAIQQLRRMLLEDLTEKNTEAHQRNRMYLIATIIGCLLLTGFVCYALYLIRQRMLLPIREAADIITTPPKNLYKRTCRAVYRTRDEASEMLLRLYAFRLRDTTRHRTPTETD